MADLHIGGWQEDTLRELNMQPFKKAIEICINEKVDLIKETTGILKRLIIG